jgi:hypothetical protein
VTRFNQTGTRAAVNSPIKTEKVASGTTYEGAPGYARDPKSELFTLAVANMVGENSFYEKADARDERYERLIGDVAVSDPKWISEFLRWLRTEGNMRSASLVGAVEAVRARLGDEKSSQEISNRKIIDSVLQRADEPGEMLAYYVSRYGRNIPKPIKRGIADAIVRMYSEYTLLKYDTASHGYRFADVIDLVHPSTDKPWQGELFKYAINRRHNRDDATPLGLGMIRNNQQLRKIAGEWPEALLSTEHLKRAGMTWEDALSLVGNKVDKAKLWEAMIPNMGIMALARNLRNFDQAGVSDAAIAPVIAKFTDPETVAKSRMFPFRWLAAHRNAPSLRWGHALDQALTHSLANVPALPGRTLILVDMSGSMWSPTAGRMSDMRRCDVAAVFGAALAMRAENAKLVIFGIGSATVPVRKGESLLTLVGRTIKEMGGTDTISALRTHFAGHDRVIILTDEQAMMWGGSIYVDQGTVSTSVPANVPMYTWNLAGYTYGHAPSGTATRHTFAGMSDAAFKLIPLLERGQNAPWPWKV